jgi:uncharacterized protein YecT (DUF1311 family)
MLATAAGAQSDCGTLATQMEITACHAERYAEAEARLDRGYEEALGRLSAEDQVALRAAQIAWVSFRAQACHLEAGAMRGGSGERMVFLDCMRRLTDRRAEDLTGSSAWWR